MTKVNEIIFFLNIEMSRMNPLIPRLRSPPPVPSGYTYDTLPDENKENMWITKQVDWERTVLGPMMLWNGGGRGRRSGNPYASRVFRLRNMFRSMKENIPLARAWRTIFKDYLHRIPFTLGEGGEDAERFRLLKEDIERELGLEERMYFQNVWGREFDDLMTEYETQQERIDALMRRCLQFS
jgi:hypothetical protein